MEWIIPGVKAGIVLQEHGRGSVETRVGFVKTRFQRVFVNDEDHHGEEEICEAHADDERPFARILTLKVQAGERDEYFVCEAHDEGAPDHAEIHFLEGPGREETDVDLEEGG